MEQFLNIHIAQEGNLGYNEVGHVYNSSDVLLYLCQNLVNKVINVSKICC